TKPPREMKDAAVDAPVSMASDEERRRSRRRRVDTTVQEAADADMKTEATDDPSVRAIADDEIMAKTGRRLRAAERKKKKDRLDVSEATDGGETVATDLTQDASQMAQLLAQPRFYADMNEYCADGIIELTISTVLRELRMGNRCYLVWFDSRVEGGVLAYDLTDENDFDGIFRLFATAPLCRPEQKVSRLRTMVADTQSIKQIFVVPAPDEETVTEFSNMGDLTDGSSQGAVELLCYEPEERFADVSARRRFMENCRALLQGNGIRLSVSHGIDPTTDEQKEASV
ncbi:MAG: hypothetical protein IKW66_03340, partial [Clostridia bacterium]|nr:hypothetical protein [Clostridia bacterium]